MSTVMFHTMSLRNYRPVKYRRRKNVTISASKKILTEIYLDSNFCFPNISLVLEDVFIQRTIYHVPLLVYGKLCRLRNKLNY